MTHRLIFRGGLALISGIAAFALAPLAQSPDEQTAFPHFIAATALAQDEHGGGQGKGGGGSGGSDHAGGCSGGCGGDEGGGGGYKGDQGPKGHYSGLHGGAGQQGFGSSVHGMGGGHEEVSRGFSRGGDRHVPTGIDSERGGRGQLFASIEGESLGRLNIARAPRNVRDRALADALDAIAAGEQVEGPLQNLALYERLGRTPSALAAEDLRAMGIYLGAAADKNIPVTTRTVSDVNRLLGLGNFDDDQITAIASKAEEVRYDRLLTHH